MKKFTIKLKVLLVNTNKNIGGAAVACGRLMDALAQNGVEVRMLTASGVKWKIRKAVERVLLLPFVGFSWRKSWRIDVNWLGKDITQTDDYKWADIVNIHWANQGILSLHDMGRIFSGEKPVVLTLHDMWHFTSICHHSSGCNAYEKECEHCHLQTGCNFVDLSHRIFRKKKKLYSKSSLSAVSVSSWLDGLVAKSSLLGDKRHYVIPNVVPLENFAIKDRMASRRRFGLPLDKKIIVFGAANLADSVKRFPLFAEAVNMLNDSDIHVLLFGNTTDNQVFELLKVPYTYIGYLSSPEELPWVYSASDICVSASAYETFGQTLSEAQACGCYPVSFGNSGQRDIIDHKVNGYLVDNQDAESLLQGILWALNHTSDTSRGVLRENVENKFSAKSVAQKYISIYNQMLSSR